MVNIIFLSARLRNGSVKEVARMSLNLDYKATFQLLDGMERFPTELQDQMLIAESEVVYREQHKVAMSDLNEEGYSTGGTAAALTVGKPKGGKQRSLELTFEGTRKNVTTERNASTVAFFNEFGSKRIRARHWIRKVNAECADEATDAAAKIYTDWLESRS